MDQSLFTSAAAEDGSGEFVGVLHASTTFGVNGPSDRA